MLSRLHSRLVFKDLNHEAAEGHVEALGELMRRALRVIPKEVELHRAMRQRGLLRIRDLEIYELLEVLSLERL